MEALDTEIQSVPPNFGKRPSRDRAPGEEVDVRLNDSSRRMLKVLQNLKKHASALPFLDPVDVRQVPDYFEVVKRPMDLSTVENKLKRGEYTSAYQFALDVRTIWDNSFCYNPRSTDLFAMTCEMSAMFEKLMKGNENLSLVEGKDEVQNLHRQVDKLSKDIQIKSKSTVEKPMSVTEKKNLCNSIKNLDPKHLSGLLSIVKENTNVQGEELEFDIEKLPSSVCRELERYVKQCSVETNKPKPVVIEEPKKETISANNKLRELDKELGELAKQGRNDPPDDDDISSSSDDSDEDDYNIPEPQEVPSAINTEVTQVQSLYDTFKQGVDIESDQDICSFGFGPMIDIDSQHDMLG